jgi:hypothetical protein
MKFVLKKTQRDKRVHIEEILHGKFERISCTCSLVSCGAPGPALRTGRPVIASRAIAGFARRPCWGTRTIFPSFTVASSASPGRSPSLRRIGPGRTTCPLLEMRVCIVRISYHARTRRTGKPIRLRRLKRTSLALFRLRFSDHARLEPPRDDTLVLFVHGTPGKHLFGLVAAKEPR